MCVLGHLMSLPRVASRIRRLRRFRRFEWLDGPLGFELAIGDDRLRRGSMRGFGRSGGGEMVIEFGEEAIEPGDLRRRGLARREGGRLRRRLDFRAGEFESEFLGRLDGKERRDGSFGIFGGFFIGDGGYQLAVDSIVAMLEADLLPDLEKCLREEADGIGLTDRNAAQTRSVEGFADDVEHVFGCGEAGERVERLAGVRAIGLGLMVVAEVAAAHGPAAADVISTFKTATDVHDVSPFGDLGNLS